MIDEDKKIIVKICMGSSCFARGNADNLEFIEKFIKENNMEAKVEFMGSRCENKCAEGPNVIINDEVCNCATKEKLETILRKYI